MDLNNIGQFLRQLRKEKNLTQEQLGDCLGVAGKTVSRWETGNYLPSIDMLQALSRFYGITINEILSGKRLSESQYREAAEENLKETVRQSSFSLAERIAFYKRKWLMEHVAFMVFLGAVLLILGIAAIVSRNVILIGCWPLAFLVAHCLRYNRMMAYIEQNAYDGIAG